MDCLEFYLRGLSKGFKIFDFQTFIFQIVFHLFNLLNISNDISIKDHHFLINLIHYIIELILILAISTILIIFVVDNLVNIFFYLLLILFSFSVKIVVLVYFILCVFHWLIQIFNLHIYLFIIGLHFFDHFFLSTSWLLLIFNIFHPLIKFFENCKLLWHFFNAFSIQVSSICFHLINFYFDKI